MSRSRQVALAAAALAFGVPLDPAPTEKRDPRKKHSKTRSYQKSPTEKARRVKRRKAARKASRRNR